MPANKYALIRYRVIDRCISNKYRPYPDVEDLIEACSEILGKEVSKSTIEKDIYAMKNDRALGYEAPIAYDREERGYYYEDESFTIRDVPLSDEEIDAIKIAANTLVQFRDIGPFKQYSSAIDKILDRVSIGPDKNDDELKSRIQFEQVPEVRGNDFLSLLFRAVSDNLTVTFDYGSYKKNTVKKRVVDPYLLKEYDNRWYLIGRSHERNDFIVYGLDRMANPEVTSESFDRDTGFDPDVYFKYSIGITANIKDKPQHVRIEVSDILAKYLDSRPLHHSQNITDQNGVKVVTLEVFNTYELKEKIMGFGAQAKVTRPESLKTEIAEGLKAAADRY